MPFFGQPLYSMEINQLMSDFPVGGYAKRRLMPPFCMEGEGMLIARAGG